MKAILEVFHFEENANNNAAQHNAYSSLQMEIYNVLNDDLGFICSNNMETLNTYMIHINKVLSKNRKIYFDVSPEDLKFNTESLQYKFNKFWF